MTEQFQFLGKVGEGAFATVFKVKRKEDSQIYAFKKIKSTNMKDRQLTNCLNEIRILASLKNPYVIGYRQAFYDHNLKSFCLVTQFAENGDLASKISKAKKKKQFLQEEQIWRTIIQLLFGIKALHNLNVFHRDIKPANILLGKNDEIAKLGDMNVSIISKTGLANTQTGTPYYASPEVWMEKSYSGKSDIWSLGCVLYEMAAQRPPFTANDMPTLRRKIIQDQADRIPNIYSDQLDKFIKSCLVKDQNIRMNSKQLLELPTIKLKLKQFPGQFFNEPYFPTLQRQSNMIATIRIPDRNNFKSLDGKLPKKYQNSNTQSNKQNIKNYNNYNRIEDNNSCLPNIQKNVILGENKNSKNASILPNINHIMKRSDSLYNKNKNNRKQYIKRIRY